MKVSRDDYVFWVAIEGDTIVAREGEGLNYILAEPLRADDTLSVWASAGWTIEGPFDSGPQ